VDIDNESKEKEEIFVDRVDFQELEQFDQWRNLYTEQGNHYDVIVLDIGPMIGNDLYLTTLSIATRVPC
jgi:MinD-like ATPase involved in chromosome partitioning or flagellar assembly